jgi:hypothetical protein
VKPTRRCALDLIQFCTIRQQAIFRWYCSGLKASSRGRIYRFLGNVCTVLRVGR